MTALEKLQEVLDQAVADNNTAAADAIRVAMAAMAPQTDSGGTGNGPPP